MQNLIQKFRQSSIVFEKLGILSEILKTLTSSNYPTVQYFLQKLCIRFLEIIEVCLNLGIGFCITWLVLPNYKKISPGKPILN